MGEDFLLYYETTNHIGHHCSYLLFLMMLTSVLLRNISFMKKTPAIKSRNLELLDILLCVCVCLVVPAAFVENSILLPFYCLPSFAKGRLTVFVWVSVWAPCSFPLTYLSVLSPIPHCLDYCNFTVSVGRELSAFQLFLLQHCFGYSGSFPSPYIL